MMTSEFVQHVQQPLTAHKWRRRAERIFECLRVRVVYTHTLSFSPLFLFPKNKTSLRPLDDQSLNFLLQELANQF